MKRIVFDLDGTLLTCDFELQREFFTELYGESANDLVNNMGIYLDEFEKKYHNYNNDDLSKFLSMKSGINIADKVIDDWIEVISSIPDTMEDGVIETLEYFKTKDCSLAVLTNWYGKSQIPRLKKAGIIDYFDNIYTGDFVLKPHKKSYVLAQDKFNVEDCLFIGDNLDKDYIGPRANGFDSIIYDKNDNYHKSLKKIKRINEIIVR